MADERAEPVNGRARFMGNKRVVTAVCVAAVVVVAAVPAAAAAPRRARLIGESILKHALRFDGSTVGGLSGIDYDPRTGCWVLVSDSTRFAARGVTVRS